MRYPNSKNPAVVAVLLIYKLIKKFTNEQILRLDQKTWNYEYNFSGVLLVWEWTLFECRKGKVTLAFI